MIDKVIEAFKDFEEVEAMLLGGSRATKTHDEKSDYDVYVYLNKPLPESKRRQVLDQYCSFMEYSNQFWELEDDGTLQNGIDLELIYRDYSFFEEIIQDMKNRNVGNGYSTCFYNNLMSSVILFDKGGKLKELQENSQGLIDDGYVQAIIDKNFPLIYKSVPALYWQVKKAMERKDYNSVNHRLAEYFAMYYDILFALNKASHPGEKRLVELASTLLYLPNDFKKKVHNVLLNSYRNCESSLNSLKTLSRDIEELILQAGYKI